jgi:two-component system chemotaxis response regulator CheY
VAEDKPDMRLIIKTMMKKLGFDEVLETADGAQAASMLKLRNLSSAPGSHLVSRKIDIVVADWRMPNMTGLELLNYVRSEPNLQKLPFCMLTAEAERDCVIAAIQSGVSDYLIKPFATQDLEEKLTTLI